MSDRDEKEREREIDNGDERKKGEQRPLEYHDAGNAIRVLPPIPLYMHCPKSERERERERWKRVCTRVR